MRDVRLTDLLIADGVLDAGVVEEVLRYVKEHGGSLDTNLLETGLLDERRLQPYLEKTYSLKNRIDPFGEAQPDAIRLLRRDQAETYRIVPFRLQMRALDVLVHDPTNIRAIDEVSFITGCRLILSVATEPRIADHLHRWYQVPIPDRMKAFLAGALARHDEMARFMASRPAGGGPDFGRMPTVELKDGGPAPPASIWLEEATSRAPTVRDVGPPPIAAEPIDLPPPASLVPPARRPTAPKPPPIPPLAPTNSDSKSTVRFPLRQPTPAGIISPLARTPERTEEIRRSYEQLAAQLVSVGSPDEVPTIVLPYLQVLLHRVVLFLVYPEHMQGWDARGPRLKREAVELIRVSLKKPSVFLWVLQSGRAFEGTIPQEDVEEDLLIRLAGASWPDHALVVPVRGRDQAVAILYGEAQTADALQRAREPAAVIADLVGETLGRLIASGRWPTRA